MTGLTDILGGMDPDQLADQLYDNPDMAQEFVAEDGFRLSEIERDSKLWLKIDKYLQDMVNILRESNDEPHNELETAKIRGKIELAKEFRQIGLNPVGGQDPDSPDLGY